MRFRRCVDTFYSHVCFQNDSGGGELCPFDEEGERTSFADKNVSGVNVFIPDVNAISNLIYHVLKMQ